MSKKFGIIMLAWALFAVNAIYATPAIQIQDDVIVIASAEKSTANKPEEKNAVTLSVSRATIGGADILAPTSVKIEDNSTAWSVLQKALDEKGIAYEYSYNKKDNGLYVVSIDGVAQGAHGNGSGWMVSVNGKFDQVSANQIKLKEGDKVEWKYTKDLGKDIGAKP